MATGGPEDATMLHPGARLSRRRADRSAPAPKPVLPPNSRSNNTTGRAPGRCSGGSAVRTCDRDRFSPLAHRPFGAQPLRRTRAGRGPLLAERPAVPEGAAGGGARVAAVGRDHESLSPVALSPGTSVPCRRPAGTHGANPCAAVPIIRGHEAGNHLLLTVITALRKASGTPTSASLRRRTVLVTASANDRYETPRLGGKSIGSGPPPLSQAVCTPSQAVERHEMSPERKE